MRALTSPIRLSDSILLSLGVFRKHEKLQTRTLAFYVLVIVCIVLYIVSVTARAKSGIALQPIPTAVMLSTLFVLGCLPYYIACVLSRRFLWKSYLIATFVCFALVGAGISAVVGNIFAKTTTPFVVQNWKTVEPQKVLELSNAVSNIVTYGLDSGTEHFKWRYELQSTRLRSSASLILSEPKMTGFLVPDSSSDNSAPIKFAVTQDAAVAAQLWSTNRDRLRAFAKLTSNIPELQASRRWPPAWYQTVFSLGTVFCSGIFLLPLGVIGALCTRVRPIIPRRRLA